MSPFRSQEARHERVLPRRSPTGSRAYIALRRSLGYSFKKQAAILRALVRYVDGRTARRPADAGDGARLRLPGTARPTAAPFATALFVALPIILRSMIRERKRSIPGRCPIPRNPAASHPERRGTRLAHVGMPQVFHRIIRARLGADAAGRIAGQHGLRSGEALPPRSR